MKYFLLTFFLALDLLAVGNGGSGGGGTTSSYVDMSDVVARADDLNMTVTDYAFAMAISGTFVGGVFGLFLWKVK